MSGDAIEAAYVAWLRVYYPGGEPSRPEDWSDVMTAFRAGYLTRHFKDGEIEKAIARGIERGVEQERERCYGIATQHAQDASEAPYKDHEDTHVDGYQDAANDIASEIFERSKP